MKRAAHPVLDLEDWLLAYLKQKLAALRPARTAFRTLFFNKPRPDADAMMFTFNGVSVGHRFFGMVTNQEANVTVKAPEKSRIITP